MLNDFVAELSPITLSIEPAAAVTNTLSPGTPVCSHTCPFTHLSVHTAVSSHTCLLLHLFPFPVSGVYSNTDQVTVPADSTGTDTGKDLSIQELLP